MADWDSDRQGAGAARIGTNDHMGSQQYMVRIRARPQGCPEAGVQPIWCSGVPVCVAALLPHGVHSGAVATACR